MAGIERLIIIDPDLRVETTVKTREGRVQEIEAGMKTNTKIVEMIELTIVMIDHTASNNKRQKLTINPIQNLNY
jgi:hypothetical protein